MISLGTRLLERSKVNEEAFSVCVGDGDHDRAGMGVAGWGPVAASAWGVTSTPTPDSSLTALDYVAQGEAYLEQGDYEQAIADFNEAIRFNPDYTKAYLGRGYAHYLQGENDLALADLNEYVRLAGENADPGAIA